MSTPDFYAQFFRDGWEVRSQLLAPRLTVTWPVERRFFEAITSSPLSIPLAFTRAGSSLPKPSKKMRLGGYPVRSATSMLEPPHKRICPVSRFHKGARAS